MSEIVLDIDGYNKIIISAEEKVHRFANCNMFLINSNQRITLETNEFMYVFIQSFYKPLIRAINSINEYPNLHGNMGQIRLLDFCDNDTILADNSCMINCSNKSWIISTTTHNLYLYKLHHRIWIEIDEDYGNNVEIDETAISEDEYYSNPLNYRVLLTEVSEATISKWINILKPYYDIVRVKN